MKGLRKQTENTEDAPLPGLSQVFNGQRSSCSAEQTKGQRGESQTQGEEERTLTLQKLEQKPDGNTSTASTVSSESAGAALPSPPPPGLMTQERRPSRPFDPPAPARFHAPLLQAGPQEGWSCIRAWPCCSWKESPHRGSDPLKGGQSGEGPTLHLVSAPPS